MGTDKVAFAVECAVDRTIAHDLLRKRHGEKAGHVQNLLPVRATSGQGLFRSRDFVTSCQKDPTRSDMGQLPVTHAQNIATGSGAISDLVGLFDQKSQSHVTGRGPVRKWP
jgi:hypothetical protein